MSGIAHLKPAQPRPDDLCVERAEELAEACRSGEVQALGYTAILADGSVRTCIVNEGGISYFTMLGALERLKLRYHNTVLDVEE